MDKEDRWNGRFVKRKDEQTIKKKGNCDLGTKDEEEPRGSGKSVIGKWLKDFRGQKEKKVRHPLGRTLSVNAKDENLRRKPTRTMSTNRKDKCSSEMGNSFDIRPERKKCSSCERNFSAEKKGDKFLSRESFHHSAKILKNNSDLAVNPDALVSYLDEEGLNAADRNIKRPTRSAYFSNRDGFMMPAPSFDVTKVARSRYDNTSDFSSNQKSKRRSKEGCESIQNHDYENLIGRRKREGKSRGEEEEFNEPETTCGFRFGQGHYYDDDGKGDEKDEEDDSDRVRSGNGSVSEAPVRDPSSLKFVKYGPGHEKYPSWPGSLQTETSEKPQRTRSWTERTDYPKETASAYARPCDKRSNFSKQLKTVMERCEKISPRTFRERTDQDREDRVYLPKVDREGKSLGDKDYMVPSPPERDEPYCRTRVEIHYRGVCKDDGDYSTPYEDVRKAQLTRADLEEYARSYDEVSRPHHQHQGSYAQSEGYHSYVSSNELAIFNRENEQGTKNRWEEEGSGGRDSVVTTSSSAGSSETLKWHGSMSDLSGGGSSSRSRQLIVHSSRVAQPQRHHSESVLYLGNRVENPSRIERSQHLKLFPVNTYTVKPFEEPKSVISPTSIPRFSVAERISELERQQQFQKPVYLDSDKRHRASDASLKAIQKKALLSFYERHQHSAGLQCNADPHGKCGNPKEHDRSNGASQNLPVPERNSFRLPSDKNAKFSSRENYARPRFPDPFAVSKVEEPAPERPPKKPRSKPTRSAPPPLPPRSPGSVDVSAGPSAEDDRSPTPDLPPPPFPSSFPEDEGACDEPLPPPPPEAEWLLATAVPRRSSPPLSVPASALDFHEIQYDQNAINAIMECNRASEDVQRRREKGYKEKKPNGDEDEKRRRGHNRPPLPLPRDVLSLGETESNPLEKMIRSTDFAFSHVVDGCKKLQLSSWRIPVSEETWSDQKSLRQENEDERFRRLFLERTNSKAAFLAVRREKELGLTTYEGRYKLTVSPSGESINSSSSSSAVEKTEISTENCVLDNRLPPLPPEPPDLIPLKDLRSRRSSDDFPPDRNGDLKFEDGRYSEENTFRTLFDSQERQNQETYDKSLTETSLQDESRTDIQADRVSSGIREEENFDGDEIREESECERLSRDLASQLSPSDKLQGLLVPDSERKRSSDYVAGLFRLECSSRSRRRPSDKSRARRSQPAHNSLLIDGDPSFRKIESFSSNIQRLDVLETKKTGGRTKDAESVKFHDAGELEKKKEELMARLDKKLEILREERIALSEECAANEELGASVAASVTKLARPSETAKYRLHVEETGKITSLLLGLSGRLARTENALTVLPLHVEERKIHESKRDKLKEQLAEAKQLKENIDKRSDSVAKILEKYLSKDEFADYLHFIRMKSKLIVDSREVAEKISLGEEQLAALKETLSS